ncbi:MAG: hypothetical protein VKQ33_14265 [Candidatus Sericytochromatia bacterium]|nr:hypothetical protein [Candidatus Sericytochromatia bacterium]
MSRWGSLILPGVARLAGLRAKGRAGEHRILGLEASLYLGLPPGNTASGWRGEFRSRAAAARVIWKAPMVFTP